MSIIKRLKMLMFLFAYRVNGIWSQDLALLFTLLLVKNLTKLKGLN